MLDGLRLLVILRHIPAIFINQPLAHVVLNVYELRRWTVDYVMMYGMILSGHVRLFDLIEPLEFGLSEDLTSLEFQFGHHHILPRLFISHNYCAIGGSRRIEVLVLGNLRSPLSKEGHVLLL